MVEYLWLILINLYLYGSTELHLQHMQLADFYLAYRKSRDHYNVLTLKESGVLPDGVLPPTRKENKTNNWWK